MTQERLNMEQAVLEQYHPGKYSIQTGDESSTIKYVYNESRYYSIIFSGEYPDTAPVVKLDYLTVNEVQDDLASGKFSNLTQIIVKEDGYYLCYDETNSYDSTWSFYKIIGHVNNWIDINDSPC